MKFSCKARFEVYAFFYAVIYARKGGDIVGQVRNV